MSRLVSLLVLVGVVSCNPLPGSLLPTDQLSVENKVQLDASATTLYPHDVLGLSLWKLQLPYSSSGSYTSGTSTEITQKSCGLKTFTDSQRFYVATDASGLNYVVMNAPVVGIPTSGSLHARVELREMSSFNSSCPATTPSSASWRADDGFSHSISFTTKIVKVPLWDKEVTFSQLFKSSGNCGTSKGFFMEFQFVGDNSLSTTPATTGLLQVMHSFKSAGGGVTNSLCTGSKTTKTAGTCYCSSSNCYYYFDPAYTLGTKFSVTLTVADNGNNAAYLYYNGAMLFTIPSGALGKTGLESGSNSTYCLSDLQFKVGNYQQSCSVYGTNTCSGATTEANNNSVDFSNAETAEVHLYAVSVTHTGGLS